MTLLILAAGIGSRYGGFKQLEPVTAAGESLIDFSIHDAILAGFDKIVFVIRREHLERFRETVGARFSSLVDIEYVFQEISDLPPKYSTSRRRERPWGTGHALLAARSVIEEPFGVINADDFYGRAAFSLLACHLADIASGKTADNCMVGYRLGNTLMDRGAVARALCTVENGRLTQIVERTRITNMGRAAVSTEGNKEDSLSLDTIVSMNCWGFTPDIFQKLEPGFSAFLDKHAADLQHEYYLPDAIMALLSAGEIRVRVYSSEDKWCGMTYAVDREPTVKHLASLKKQKLYPSKLNHIKRG
ncbi:MAG: NTP transferase domain-containing protein [Clostridia bacterium]|nr:NTP transferase domain-containing protein [Clostridia bacterium]